MLWSAVIPMSLSPLFVVYPPDFGLLLLEDHLDRFLRVSICASPAVV